MTLYKWSSTAASNATADATINWAEGQAPSSVNDSARAMMAAVAKYRDDRAGTVTTGGTSTAYTATSNQVFASLATMSGQAIRLKMSATNGASPTLNVDGLGAKNIVTVTGTAVATGALISGGIYDFVYNNSSSEWFVVGKYAPNEFASGTVMLFVQTAAPTGWTKGSTHNDKALRLVTGTASTGGSTAFTSVLTSRTIAQANLPNVTLTTTITDPGHTHGLSNEFGNQAVDAGASLNVASLNRATTGTGEVTNSATTGITASTSLGGSGTAMDFAVNYVDVILATRD